MTRVEQSVDVAVPARVAYDQWTQFEEFPRFMDGVESVEQESDRQLRWTATVAGVRREWRAVITDQTPDVRIAWRSIEGAVNAGAVLFTPLGPDHTRVTLTLEAEPQGPVETVGTAVGLLGRQVDASLDGFKRFVEARAVPTGAWRGEIHGNRVEGKSQ
jgi:uncharacterized membrane protein